MIVCRRAPLAPLDRFTIRGNFQATVIALRPRAGAAIAQARRRGGDSRVRRLADAATGVRRDGGGARRAARYGIDSAGAPRASRRRPAAAVRAARRRRRADVLGAGTTCSTPCRAPARSSRALRVHRDVLLSVGQRRSAVARGTDPRLADEYVLYSAHQDHDGVRYAVERRLDLERRRRQRDGERRAARDRARVREAAGPALGAVRLARRGGARAARLALVRRRIPTVPLTQIVAVLNGDMIGRNDPDTRGAARRAAAAPQLGRRSCTIALDANTRVTQLHARLALGSSDAPRGLVLPQRSPAVRARRRAGDRCSRRYLHPDYHTPRDEPDRDRHRRSSRG